MDQLAKFLFEAGMLKQTPRSGFQFLGSGGESVAEHSFRTALIGYSLARKVPGANADRVMRFCLFHDLHEARTGDLNYVNKKYVKADDQKASRDLAAQLDFGADFLSWQDEVTEASTIEARLARDADQLDMILNLKECLDRGNAFAAQWYPYALERLCTAEGRRLAEAIWRGDSLRWWLDDDHQWWVRGEREDELDDSR